MERSVTDEIERTEVHHRQIDIRFFRRSDGLYEVEGRLLDRKSHAFRRPLQDSETPPGQPLHDITVRLVADENSLVHDASASYSAAPFALCHQAAQTLEPLIGLRIGGGWNKRVRELLGGAASCTHIVELLGPMASTLHQGFAPKRIARMREPGNEEHKSKLDSCYSYGRDREVVARLWPHLATRKEAART
jgi:hypothetical protein